jgi:hypothetical protein
MGDRMPVSGRTSRVGRGVDPSAKKTEPKDVAKLHLRATNPRLRLSAIQLGAKHENDGI